MSVYKESHFILVKFSDNDYERYMYKALKALVSYLEEEFSSLAYISNEHISLFLADFVARLCAMDASAYAEMSKDKYEQEKDFDYESYYNKINKYLLENITIVHGVQQCVEFLLNNINMPNTANEFCLNKREVVTDYLKMDKENFYFLNKVFWTNYENAVIRICPLTDIYKSQICII